MASDTRSKSCQLRMNVVAAIPTAANPKRREALGLSRQEAADRAGINFDYLGSIERGERNVATINLARLARALDYDDMGQLTSGLSLAP